MGHTDYPYGVIFKGIFDFFLSLFDVLEKCLVQEENPLY